MRIAHASDLHVTEGPRLADQAETLSGMVDAMLEARPDLVLLTGDFYGRTVPHRSTPAERAVLFPAVVRLAGVAPVVVVYGNHDHDPDLDALEHLGGEWPVIVVKTARVVEVPTPAGVAHVYAIPYPSKRWLLAGEDAPRGLAESQRLVGDRLGALVGLWAHRIRRRRVAAPAEVHVLAAHLQVAGSSTAGGEVLAGQEIELTPAQLDVLPVDYGALGHLHLRQEPALRCWYPGSPWRNDYGERDPKGWHLVDVHPGAPWPLDQPLILRGLPNPDGGTTATYGGSGERHYTTVRRMPTRCRDFLTLDWRWAADHEDGAPRWITRPSDADLTAAAGAEVRARLVVPEQWVAGCPWADELGRLALAGAHRVQAEKKIEPTLRVRAPEVAAAPNHREELLAYWRTLATQPDALEQQAALDLLAEMEAGDDEALTAETRAALA